LKNWKKSVLGFQQVFTMFGSPVMVPYLTGIPVSITLFSAGAGTLFFHLMTKLKVPVFLGSSFAYISPIISVTSYYAANMDKDLALAYATGGIIAAGLLQSVIGLIVGIIGTEKVNKLFPSVITGTMIMLIGLKLAPDVISMASQDWVTALVVIGVIVFIKLYTKGFTSMVPVLIGVGAGYLLSLILGNVQFTPEPWFGIPTFTFPKFSVYAISIIAPAAIATSLEHIGDIYAVSLVTGKKFYKDPGFRRTMMGDGLATALAGFMGAPANTTYSENTAVLALTRVFDPVIMRIAAVIAIILSFIPQIGAVISSIPKPVMGGALIILFGMIASVGLKTLVENKVSINAKNMFIIALMTIPTLGGASIKIGPLVFEGLGLAGIIGIFLNLILKEKKEESVER